MDFVSLYKCFHCFLLVSFFTLVLFQAAAAGRSCEVGGAAGSELVGDGIHYLVPRVRLMFAAEDPMVFARRVAYAQQTR